MRSTPATTKNAMRTLLWVFLLIALALIFGYYLLHSAGSGGSIEHTPSPSTQQQ